MPPSNPPRPPDLIFIAPSPGWLDVVACQTAGRDLPIVWQERQPLGEQGALAARLGDVLRQHALPAQTRAVLIVPPGVGGLAALPALAGVCREADWCRRQLELLAPYPLAEIRHGVRCGGGLAQLFWLPAAWLGQQQQQFRKLGLKLAEVYPRAALFETGCVSPGFDGVLCESSAQGELVYACRDGRVRQTAQLPPGLDATARQACLAGLREGVPPPAEMAVRAPAWGDSLPALWQDPGMAIPADGGSASLWAPFVRIALFAAAAIVVLAGALSWAIAAKEAALSQAVREKKKLAPAAQRFQELERSLREESAIVAAIKEIDAAPTPLPLLAQFTQTLPKQAWVQHMTYDGKAITMAGKGIGDDALIGLLQKAGLEAEKTRPEPVPESDDFRLRVRERPAQAKEEPPAPGGGGAS